MSEKSGSDPSAEVSEPGFALRNPTTQKHKEGKVSFDQFSFNEGRFLGSKGTWLCQTVNQLGQKAKKKKINKNKLCSLFISPQVQSMG